MSRIPGKFSGVGLHKDVFITKSGCYYCFYILSDIWYATPMFFNAYSQNRSCMLNWYVHRYGHGLILGWWYTVIYKKNFCKHTFAITFCKKIAGVNVIQLPVIDKQVLPVIPVILLILLILCFKSVLLPLQLACTTFILLPLT